MNYEVSPKVRQTLDKLLALESVQKAMAFAEQDAEQTLENQIELCKIEAPTFHEQQKAARYAEMYQELGLKDVHIDEHGNVVGVRPGVGGGGHGHGLPAPEGLRLGLLAPRLLGGGPGPLQKGFQPGVQLL